MPSGSEKMHTMKRNGTQKNLSKIKQPNEHLSFSTASSSSSYSESALRREHIVDREWGGVDGTFKPQTTSPQQQQQQQQQQAQSASSPSPMMQRWQGESNREQPYNTVGRYSTMKEADSK